MLKPQPLNAATCEKLEAIEKKRASKIKPKPVSQYVGDLFDDLSNEKFTLGENISWYWREFKNACYDVKHALCNCFRWRETMNILRPWEGYHGMLTVMIAHLSDYIKYEEKYGNSEETYKARKIAAAKKTVEILKRMRACDCYLDYRLNEVYKKYPKYKSLITRTAQGETIISGDFIRQEKGYVGKESGANPREGYFEFVDGKFELTKSPDQAGTNKLLAQLAGYHKDVNNAYEQAELDSKKDFERLHRLLEAYMYQWWD